MNERQLRMLRWLSRILDSLANPDLRKRLTQEQIDSVVGRAHQIINAELALADTSELGEFVAEREIAELERIYGLQSDH